MYSPEHIYPLVPVKISSNRPLDKIHRKNLNLISDGDWSSFYMHTKGEQLTFDLGRPYMLDHFVLIPRNDDNYIHLGDKYELFYHNGINGWKSLGIEKASCTKLTFDSVPQNALLWLHNHTRGKEERCFYMKDGKQVFI